MYRKALCGATVGAATPTVSVWLYLNGWGTYVDCDRCNDLMSLKLLAKAEL